MANNSNMIPIPGRLHSVATDGQVAGANEIHDDAQDKNQSTINSELINAVGSGGSVDSRIADAKAEIIGDAATDYNTLGKLEDKIQAEASRAEGAESALDGRVDTLEDAVGTGGSVDSRISAAVATETARAQAAEADRYTKSETYTKTEVNGLVDTPHQEYVTVDAYASLPATGSKDTIYRVSNYNGSTSQVDASVYSEYAWNGSQYVFLCVKSQIGEVFDISVYNNNAKYADLAAALNGGANIPQSLQKGGMSVKFVQSSDNKYVQYRLMANSFSTTESDWQGVDDEPIAGSENLVKSGGVAEVNGSYILDEEYAELCVDNEDRIIEGVKVNGTKVFGSDVVVKGKINNVDINSLERAVELIQPIKILIIGDSYSADGFSQWVNPMMSHFPEGSSYISLAVGSASIKDHYADRTQYPYTSRPVSSDVSGNKNTFACQIEKLKRLMTGVDLDPSETQIYTSVDEYPNVIIIEGGMNDYFDADEVVATYKNQFIKYVTDVYIRPAYEETAVLGNTYIKTPVDEVNRTCFAGAYRYLCDELTSLFTDAQVFITTRSGLGYWNGDVVERGAKIASQQRICADYCGFPVIDWHNDAQISIINNYPNGDGSQNNPYTQGLGVHGSDTYDSMHPTAQGGKKYGSLAALIIKQKLLRF